MEETHTHRLSEVTVRRLSQLGGTGPFVSLYMPTGAGPVANGENRIRLQNLITAARRELEAGLLSGSPGLLLEPLEKLLGDRHFWSRQRLGGLACFRSPDVLELHRVADPVPERVVVGDRFHIRPLLPSLVGNGRFHVLAMSQHDAQLYAGDRFGLWPRAVPGLPPKAGEPSQSVLPRRDRDLRSLQYHTLGGTLGSIGGPRSPAIYHGHGSSEDRSKIELEKYLRVVAEAIDAELSGERTPLVLACVEYLLPMYQEVSRHPDIVDRPVTGNPKSSDLDALHDGAWELVRARFAPPIDEVRESFEGLRQRGLALTGLDPVLDAAGGGCVAALYLPEVDPVWGRFHAGYPHGSTEVHAQREIGDEDLMDRAAVLTLAHGGTVYALTPDAMPTGDLVAATLRFAA
jgi:hypothetical protein